MYELIIGITQNFLTGSETTLPTFIQLLSIFKETACLIRSIEINSWWSFWVFRSLPTTPLKGPCIISTGSPSFRYSAGLTRSGMVSALRMFSIWASGIGAGILRKLMIQATPLTEITFIRSASFIRTKMYPGNIGMSTYFRRSFHWCKRGRSGKKCSMSRCSYCCATFFSCRDRT